MKIDESLMLNQQSQSRQTNNDDLGRDAFLQILMTQLTNQDPLDPMDDKDFIAQMATFSQLEQMTNMANDFTGFMENQSYSNFLQYSNLIGQAVNYGEFSDGELEEELSAVVQSVRKEGDGIIISLDNGEEISAEEVTQIGQVDANDEGDSNE
ncbi:flagellar basal-body rod modification protein FlgD [Alkalibacillus filiformis]|uniref:Flagellar basal-body rod modification protein FlgD n=1 Tax=Alkalibacillus filiformis TaxID=200990 RepID=A0ABU0DQB5_9BACI|nr:flagellar hook assembly protein FlgD [Alkalibacillus filiformis]MDQ0350625.1 flagellar basal-body rod modification protein FlgD [Alkalibacillus filiformis]